MTKYLQWHFHPDDVTFVFLDNDVVFDDVNP